ncbi:MAG: LysR family transcriptional regulator [Gammaproteobacteria bacterium]|nr:LysR family transcriptional regulator [Gammaproteobacteria bacterium]
MDKLSSIRVFLAIARRSTFTAAAAEIGISKAMASKHIEQLERSLGVRLLNRSTRRVGLTEAGAVYRDRMRDILDDLRETEDEIAQLGSEPRGTLRLMSPVSFGAFHLTRAISDFHQRFPQLGVDMTLADRAPDIIEEGFDLAIRIGEIEESSLVARRIAEVRIVLCASPEYLQRAGTPASPTELVNHNCLTYAGRQPFREWTFTLHGVVQTVPVSGSLWANVGDPLRRKYGPLSAFSPSAITRCPTGSAGPPDPMAYLSRRASL